MGKYKSPSSRSYIDRNYAVKRNGRTRYTRYKRQWGEQGVDY